MERPRFVGRDLVGLGIYSGDQFEMIDQNLVAEGVAPFPVIDATVAAAASSCYTVPRNPAMTGLRPEAGLGEKLKRCFR